ncbi:titin homolog [Nilaparvata lugens]|uniref:titin homolog n=1 Tax=Nilaparvata lugens TaxID=108931 RepID=UPI00193CC2EF|nr:titin homolog [Nilaparvata lugens]XP_039292178.1 titin homolog [Nilaparvata lugens]XP_039292179.1 titin homolog [Nilaparvata lugens]
MAGSPSKSAPAVFIAAIFLLISTASTAPVDEEDSTALSNPQDSQITEYYGGTNSTSCYYNYQQYQEGDRIITQEPCLNCTCQNRMLMCYLRVCPYTKDVGQDCTVEKRSDQCCPVITCPQVPVQLQLQASSTTVAPPTTAVAHPNSFGCEFNGAFFPDGAQVPPDPKNPCELCYCIRNRTACVLQECTLNVDGCRAVYQKGVCCPVRYDCDYDRQATTTEASSGLIITTTAETPQQCEYGGVLYNDGELIVPNERSTMNSCEKCYCMRGEIVCAVQNCGNPMEGKDCEPVPPPEGQCCPTNYICANETIPFESEDPKIHSDSMVTDPDNLLDKNADKMVESTTAVESEVTSESSNLQPITVSNPTDENEHVDSEQASSQLDPESETIDLSQVPAGVSGAQTEKTVTEVTENTNVGAEESDKEKGESLPEANEPDSITSDKVPTEHGKVEMTTVISNSNGPQSVEIDEPEQSSEETMEEHDKDMATPMSPVQESEKVTETPSHQTESAESSGAESEEHNTEKVVTPEHAESDPVEHDEDVVVPEEETHHEDTVHSGSGIESDEKEAEVEVSSGTTNTPVEISKLPEEVSSQTETDLRATEEPSKESEVTEVSSTEKVAAPETNVPVISNSIPQDHVVENDNAEHIDDVEEPDLVNHDGTHDEDSSMSTQVGEDTSGTEKSPVEEIVPTTVQPTHVDNQPEPHEEVVSSDVVEEAEQPPTPDDKHEITVEQEATTIGASIDDATHASPAESNDIPDSQNVGSSIHEEKTDRPAEDNEIPVNNDETKKPQQENDDESAVDPTTVQPIEKGTIPGEGSCLVDGVTYSDGAKIPTSSPCHTECKCYSSIIKCQMIECPPPPSYLTNCIPVPQGEDSCCPVYSCDDKKKYPSLESQSQIGGVTTEHDDQRVEDNNPTETANEVPAATTEGAAAGDKVEVVKDNINSEVAQDNTNSEVAQDNTNSEVAQDNTNSEVAQDNTNSEVAQDNTNSEVAQDNTNSEVAQDNTNSEVAQDNTNSEVAQDNTNSEVAQDNTNSGVAQDNTNSEVAQDNTNPVSEEEHSSTPGVTSPSVEVPAQQSAVTEQDEPANKPVVISDIIPQNTEKDEVDTEESVPGTTEGTNGEHTSPPAQEEVKLESNESGSTEQTAGGSPVVDQTTLKPEHDEEQDSQSSPEQEQDNGSSPEITTVVFDNSPQTTVRSDVASHDVAIESGSPTSHDSGETVESVDDDVQPDTQETEEPSEHSEHEHESNQQVATTPPEHQETNDVLASGSTNAPVSEESTSKHEEYDMSEITTIHPVAHDSIPQESMSVEGLSTEQQVSETEGPDGLKNEVTESASSQPETMEITTEPIREMSVEHVQTTISSHIEIADKNKVEEQSPMSTEQHTTEGQTHDVIQPNIPAILTGITDDVEKDGVSHYEDQDHIFHGDQTVVPETEHSATEKVDEIESTTATVHQHNDDSMENEQLPVQQTTIRSDLQEITSISPSQPDSEPQQPETEHEEVPEAPIEETSEAVISTDPPKLEQQEHNEDDDVKLTEGETESVHEAESSSAANPADEFVTEKQTEAPAAEPSTETVQMNVDENKSEIETTTRVEDEKIDEHGEDAIHHTTEGPAAEPNLHDIINSMLNPPITHAPADDFVNKDEHKQTGETESYGNEDEDVKKDATTEVAHQEEEVGESEHGMPSSTAEELPGSTGEEEGIKQENSPDHIHEPEINTTPKEEIPEAQLENDNEPHASTETPHVETTTEKLSAMMHHHESEVYTSPVDHFPHLPMNQWTQKPFQPEVTSEPPRAPEEDNFHPPSAGETDYEEEEESVYEPGACRFGGKIFISAQQVPRENPCDFCFCFRSDIICLQQSCPPPILGCREESIHGFCCPRYECPVSMATTFNFTTTTTTTTTTLPPHFLAHNYRGAARRGGCQVQNKFYRVGDEIPTASGPCLQCICGANGQMKCDPKVCSPEPMIRKMIEEAERR